MRYMRRPRKSSISIHMMRLTHPSRSRNYSWSISLSGRSPRNIKARSLPKKIKKGATLVKQWRIRRSSGYHMDLVLVWRWGRIESDLASSGKECWLRGRCFSWCRIMKIFRSLARVFLLRISWFKEWLWGFNLLIKVYGSTQLTSAIERRNSQWSIYRIKY